MILPYLTVLVAIAAICVYRFLGDKGVIIGTRIPGTLSCEPPLTIRVKSLMMVIVSLAVLFSALYMILSKDYGEGAEKWAFGAVGSILGFWLHPKNT